LAKPPLRDLSAVHRRHDVRQKLLKLMTDAGIKALIMPYTCEAEAREDWIERHMKRDGRADLPPEKMMTGLDLIQFPC